MDDRCNESEKRVVRWCAYIGRNQRGEAAVADDAPLQRALQDPAQLLLLLERRLQLRNLHTPRRQHGHGHASIDAIHGVRDACI